MNRDRIQSPATGGVPPPPLHPSPYYTRLALERVTPKQNAYLGNVGGVDRPLQEVSLGFGEDALVGVQIVEERT